MKKLLITIIIGVSMTVNSSAQIESLAGPRLGFALITPSPSSGLINGYFKFGDLGDDLPENYNSEIKSAVTSLYGWQWESRFADGGKVTGIVEWIALVGGIEKGYFLPSISSMVGARSSNGFEFAMGPNLSLSGIGMVIGAGYNFKSGNLNIPVNIGFVPGKIKTEKVKDRYDYNYEYVSGPFYDENGNQIDVFDENGNSVYYFDLEPTETLVSEGYEFDYNTGSRFSITVGFNMNR